MTTLMTRKDFRDILVWGFEERGETLEEAEADADRRMAEIPGTGPVVLRDGVVCDASEDPACSILLGIKPPTT